GTPMCTSNLLHDLFALIFVKGQCATTGESGRPISTIPLKYSGARHFAGELYGLQEIMTGDEKLTTSHPVTDCRNG
ncbi:MAG: hypothetical protein ACRERD_21875, partial [Candidatus Binatia bacterium]